MIFLVWKSRSNRESDKWRHSREVAVCVVQAARLDDRLGLFFGGPQKSPKPVLPPFRNRQPAKRPYKTAHTRRYQNTREPSERDAREIFGCHPLSDKLCIFMYDNETAVGISNQHALKVTASAAKRDHQSSHLIHKHRDSVCDMGSDWLCAPGRNSFYGIMICKLFMDQYKS